MTNEGMSGPEAIERALRKFLPDDPYDVVVKPLALSLASIAKAHDERRFKSLDPDTRKAAVAQLQRWETALKKALSTIETADNLTMDAILEATTGEPFILPKTPFSKPSATALVGRPDAIDRWETDIHDQLAYVQKAKSALQQLAPPGGRPQAVGALQLAIFCLQIFNEYVGEAKAPVWDPVSDAAKGPYHDFVKEIFAATGVDETAREFARQAVEWQAASKRETEIK